MKKRWIFILCCILLILLVFLYVRMGYVYPKVIRVDRLELENLHITAPLSFDIDADLVIKNPNTLSMKIKSIECDVFIDSLKATHLYQIREASIPAFSEFILPVKAPVVFQDNEVIRNLGSLLIKGITGDKLKIRLKGKATVSAWGFEKENAFDITYDYGLNSSE